MTYVVDSYTVGPLHLKIFADTSDCAQHPTKLVVVDDGWHILGGGAFVDWGSGTCTGPGALGNLLTAMFPVSEDVWQVDSKDHLQPSPAQITGYCIAAQMQDGTSIPPGDYQIFRSAKSPIEGQPVASVAVADGWVLVGGGAQVDYGGGVGSMLYASYPHGENVWVARAKDHLQSSPAQVTAFAIGLRRSFLDSIGLTTCILTTSSASLANHPAVSLVSQNFFFVGGGALVNWSGVGNLLTASFPQDRQNWRAEGKDHLEPDQAFITVWGIGLVPINNNLRECG